MTRLVCVALVMVAACKGDEVAKPPAGTAETAKTAKTAKTVETPAAADPGLAAKPKQRVTIERLGLSLEVPEGTTVSPPRDADSATTSAHLEQGEFMVNLRAVDEYSVPSFADAQKTSSSDKLIASIRAEETPTGWITMREVESALHEKVIVEVSVRTVVSGKKWDCSVAAPNRALADLALAACLTLSPMNRIDGDPPVEAKPAAPAKSASRTAAPKATTAKAATVQASVGSIQGGLGKDVVGQVVRRSFSKFQRCHEAASGKAAKVTAIFVIGNNGKVSTVSASGDDAALSRCIASAFQGMTFPAPNDGKPVKVSYPLRFAAAT